MRYLTVLLAMLLLLEATPGLPYLVGSVDAHTCSAQGVSDDCCPDDEKGCAGEVHTCVCCAWPAFLAAADLTEVLPTGDTEVLQAGECQQSDLEGFRPRVERPPRRS